LATNQVLALVTDSGVNIAQKLGINTTLVACFGRVFALMLNFILLRTIRMGQLLGNEADRIGRVYHRQ